MKKSATINTSQQTKTPCEDFTPSKEQIETLALRLMPEIKKFFADERMQREFIMWKEQRKAG